MFSLKKLSLAAIAFILGFTVTLSFRSLTHPKPKETADVRQLRESLSQQKMRTEKLNAERSQIEQLLARYEHNPDQQKVKAMKNALQQLKKEAGLTEVSGQGIIIRVEPLISGSLVGQKYHPVTADLLRELINELNSFGAKQISIAGERVIATTPIRNVNGEVYVNDRQIPDVPFTIKVLADHVQQFHEEVMVSNSRRDFAEARLNLISRSVKHLTLPAYNQPIIVKHMKPTRGDS